MADKLTTRKKRFIEMYNLGKTYSEIAKALNISIITVTTWRKKLGLPRRRRPNFGAVSWMDLPNSRGISPKQLLNPIAKEIGITQNDIKYILMRVEKLKDEGLVRGRRYECAVLAAAYMYLRWEGSGRRPIPELKFLNICENKLKEVGLSIDFSTRSFHKMCNLFKRQRLYPPRYLKPERLLERVWLSFQEKFSLPLEIKEEMHKMLREYKEKGRSAHSVVAAIAYIVCNANGFCVTQSSLQDFFGVTEVTIRNTTKSLKERISYSGVLNTGKEKNGSNQKPLEDFLYKSN